MDAPLTAILANVLQSHVGEQLTEDLAARIGASVLRHVYPGPVDISGISPVRVGSYVLGPMRAREVLPELQALHAQHWTETEGYRHELPFNPDYRRGLELEAQGRYLLLCALHEETKELVGNYGLYLGRSMHTQTLMATEDTLYIAPAHRKGRLGVAMIRYAEGALTQLGVRELNVDVKLTNDVGEMIQRLGYKPVGRKFTKVLGVDNTEEGHVRA
jgi:GNAT superfamily N-acetyltransferase